MRCLETEGSNIHVLPNGKKLLSIPGLRLGLARNLRNTKQTICEQKRRSGPVTWRARVRQTPKDTRVSSRRRLDGCRQRGLVRSSHASI